MRTTLVITIVVILSAVIVAIVALIRDSELDANGQHELAYYLHYRELPPRSILVQQLVHALYPWNFTPQMSRASFGDGPYYRTTVNYQAITQPAFPWTTPPLSPLAALPARPLPYPPQDVWCAFLKSDDDESPTLVFIVLHQDLYNADWIVHEASREPDPELILARVGCAIKSH